MSSFAPLDYMAFAIDIAREAGAATLPYFRSGVDVERKPDDSPVTRADREAERLLRDRISARFPDHGILGEELGESSSAGRHRWILDPIDGTQSFIRGVPLYGVLVGFEVDSRMTVGVAYFPALDEMVNAAVGEGCWWNGDRARVSSTACLAQATVAYTNAADLDRLRGPAWRRLQDATRIQRGWGDCYGHCLVATGRADVALDPIMNVWDCAALLPILTEAGGTFTDWSGRPGIDGGHAISTNGHLLKDVLKTID
jgi:myo-inositol-1(or 4)-monophosphatase